jgi:NhaP-type Na+/H+ and K+/H+ antiporter
MEGSDTLGGFIYAELGKVPIVGDRVVHDDLELTVESVAGRRIRKVRVQRRSTPPPGGGEADGRPSIKDEAAGDPAPAADSGAQTRP